MRQEWYALDCDVEFNCIEKCFKLKVGIQTLLKYIHTYLLTYLLSYSPQMSPSWEVNRFSAKFPAFYRTRSFITTFTSARHLTLSTYMYRVYILSCAGERHLCYIESLLLPWHIVIAAALKNVIKYSRTRL